jgi:hypothetical protein
MPTDNRRIAAYLPKEIDDRFQAFKQEKGVSESKALILIMSEYFGVSQQVTYSSDSPLAKQVEELSSLVSDLKSELSSKVGEERISKLKSELLNELKSDLISKSISEPPKQLDMGVEVVTSQGKPETSKSKEMANGIDILSTTQLAKRLGCKNGDITTKKFHTKKTVEVFVKWSRDRDPEGYGWEFRSDSTLFYKVAH